MNRSALYTILLLFLGLNANAHNFLYSIDSTEDARFQLLNFEAVVSSKIVHFKWDIEKEKRGTTFIIEKSIDKINWKEVKQVESIGDHKSTHTYKVSEINFVEGAKEYFRISRENSKGERLELDIIEINQPILSNMLVLPPAKKATSSLVVSYDSMIDSKGVLFVKNEQGEIVYQKSMPFDEGYNRAELKMNKLEKGSYVVVLRDEYGNKVSRTFNTYKKQGRTKF
jgi:hypothetical protein